ncbi:TPA: type II secretion system F family protein [Providencia rettgeri]|nr:type II secretion system F family protein [Providencia rettgeri]
MFIYSYTAIDSNNQLTHSTLIAKNKKHAFINISERNLIPIHIKLKSLFTLDKKNINYRVHFFHQLSLLSSSGINLVQCFKILHTNCQLPFWNDIIESSIIHMEKGEKLSQYLQKHPLIFNDTVISIITIAEKTGQYEESFSTINKILEHNNRVSLLINKSIRYPIILSLFSIVLLLIMMFYVVPQFESIYENVQHELPLITKIITFTSNLLRDYSLYLFIVLLFACSLVFKFKGKTLVLLKNIIMHLPIFKKSLQLHNLSLYFLTMHSTINVGLSLSECLKCTIQTISNPQYQKDCKYIHTSVHRGDLLSYAMKQTKFFPDLSVQLMSIAEESGKIHYFSNYLFKYYSEQYIFITERNLKNLEPILLVLIAILVGTIMLAMYLPIFNLGNVITEL